MSVPSEDQIPPTGGTHQDQSSPNATTQSQTAIAIAGKSLPPMRIFTKLRMPGWMQLFFYLAILSTVVFVAIVPSDSLHWRFGLAPWSHPNLGAVNEMSAAMMWLLAANLTSFFAVLLLFLELRKLDRMIRNLTFALDAERAKARLGYSGPKLEKAGVNPLRWALRPLEWMYVISELVMIATIVLWVFIYASRPAIGASIFAMLVFFTGLIYLALMTCGDFFASTAYKRVTCLKPAFGESGHSDFSYFVEALSDYDRLLKYVDGPILFSMVVIIVHKFFVLNVPGYYQLGFFAGSIAMHTIIANVISIVIAASYTEVVHDNMS